MTHHMNIYAIVPKKMFKLIAQIQQPYSVYTRVSILKAINIKLRQLVTTGLFAPAGPTRHLLKQMILELVAGSYPSP